LLGLPMQLRQDETPEPVNRSHPLRGVWVRNLKVDYIGYIAYVEKRKGKRAKLWIVYPPGRLPDDTRVKDWSAGSCYADEVKRLKWPKRKQSW